MQRDFVRAEMVKLGKPRDKFWLPRITQPPAAATAGRDQARRRPEREGRAARGAEARGPEHLEGSEARARARAQAGGARGARGAGRGGAERIEARARRTRRSATSTWPRSSGCSPQNYNLPAGMSAGADPDAARDPLHDRRGRNAVGDQARRRSSGNPLVDDACVSAAQLTRKVPPPPAGSRVRGLHRRVREEVVLERHAVISRRTCET